MGFFIICGIDKKKHYFMHECETQLCTKILVLLTATVDQFSHDLNIFYVE